MRQGSSVAVIGAGPAGLGAAYALSRSGTPVTLYEASAEVGGLARSFDLWGQTVDLGPHLLQRLDGRIDALWAELIGDAYDAFPRRTRILSAGRFYTYPFEIRDVVRSLGLRMSAACAMSVARQHIVPPSQGGDLASWGIGRFGQRAFDMLFRGYVEKLFGIEAEQIDRSFGETLLSATQRGSLLGAAIDLLRPNRGDEGASYRHLIVRPRGGVGVLMNRLADFVSEHGGHIVHNTRIEQLVVEGGAVRGLLLPGGTVVYHDVILSTMPVSLLVRNLPTAPPALKEVASGLRTRGALLVYMLLSGSPWPDQWIFLMDPNVRACRVTNFANFLPPSASRSVASILAVEFWCDPADSLWQADDARLLRLASEELRELELLLPHQEVRDVHVVRVPRAFPVLHRGYRDVLEAIMKHVHELQLITLGRFGSFGNENVHSSIIMGMEMADSVVRETTTRP